jgi:hypothetical protein
LPVGFTFDEHQKWREAEQAYAEMKEKEPISYKRMAYAGHANDKEWAQLQMADLMAYEARLRIINPSEQRLAFDSLARKHSIYYIGHMRKQHLLAELEEAKAKGIVKC